MSTHRAVDRSVPRLRGLVAVAALAAALLAAPTGAEAAKVKITGGTINVTDNAVASIKLKNPNRSSAKGTLTLKSGGSAIGRSRFSIPARRSRRVRVQVVADAALLALAQGESVPAKAYAKAKRKGTSRKGIVLTWPGASPDGGSGTGSDPVTPPPVPDEGIPDRAVYEGATDQGEKIKLSIEGGAVRARGLQVRGTCLDSRDYSTTLESGHVFSSDAFPIAGDGTFAGEGTEAGGLSGFGSGEVRYKISGQITGGSARGTMSMAWERLGANTYPTVTTWQIFCEGEVTWTAERL
jgi:hypothetical protein